MSAPATDHPAAPEASPRGDVLEVFCDRAKALFERQQQRVLRLEADLSRHVETAIEEIDSRRAIVEQREAQSSQLEARLAQLSRERDQALAARGEAESLLCEARSAISQVSHQQHDLRAQLAQCHEQLNEKRRQLADARSETSCAASELDELRQRLETATAEIRELKKRNIELNDQLAKARKGTTHHQDVPFGGFDWEAQKRRLMIQLESDFGTSGAAQASDRLTVESTIRITEQVIAEKDRELQQLKQLLEDQSSTAGDVAVGAAAIAGLLDQDELIRQERATLKQLQEEWRDKLRQAEIDISVERARLGRERAELQSQTQKVDQQRQTNESFADGEKVDNKQPRGLWLKRLGLTAE